MTLKNYLEGRMLINNIIAMIVFILIVLTWVAYIFFMIYKNKISIIFEVIIISQLFGVLFVIIYVGVI